MINLCFEWKLDTHHEGGRAHPRGDPMLSINGLHMHIEAFRVHDVDGEQVAFSDIFAQDVDALQTLGFTALSTVQLPGLLGDWIIAITPHGS